MADLRSRMRLEQSIIDLVPALRSFAHRFYTSPADVEDLVQETILKALAHIDQFQEGTRLKSWLFTIMRNHFSSRFSLAKREQIGVSETIANLQTTPATQEWTLRGHELESAITQLPPVYRSAIDLVFIQGLSYEVAAQHCDCPLGTMKSRVKRARDAIIAALDTTTAH